MFSALENEYIKGLISSYQKEGYEYYLCHTVTDTTSDFDICMYFSKKEIQAITDVDFSIEEAVCIKIDSSSRNDYNNNSIYSRDIVENGNFSGSVNVHVAEFIYTNAVIEYDMTSLSINPDILQSGTTNYKIDVFNSTSLVLIGVIIIYIFIQDLFFSR